MNWLHRIFGKRKTAIEVVRRDPSKLRLHVFRSSPPLVSSAMRIMANPDFQLMLDVVRNEHPGNQVFQLDAPPHLRAAQQARCEGYTMALANLESMSTLEEPKKPLEATFEDEVTPPE